MSTRNPKVCGSGALLKQAFEKSGYPVDVLPWDKNADWSRYASLFVLECWNYHLNRDAFLRWVEERTAEQISVWNPLDILRWNTDKSYLLELQKKGILILPTVFLRPDDTRSVSDVIGENGWTDAVIKPAVGASAFGTQKVSMSQVFDVDAALDRSRTWVVQKFYPDIGEGEYSFIFFNRTFSHAVLKVPAKNEYRVHVDFGGRELPVSPDPSLIRAAQKIIDTVSGPLLYARVDAVKKDNSLILMELELTEPYLFFDAYPEAAVRFVNAYKALTRGSAD